MLQAAFIRLQNTETLMLKQDVVRPGRAWESASLSNSRHPHLLLFQAKSRESPEKESENVIQQHLRPSNQSRLTLELNVI